MNKEKKVLFGVDSSEFARDAVCAAAKLFKDTEDLKISPGYKL